MMSRTSILSLGVLAALAVPGLASAQSWGTLKGQVVFAGDKAPERPKINVDKDQAACLKKGALYSEDLVVDEKTKGVRWVMVWLVNPKNPMAPLPIHPSLKDVKEKEVSFDQPCCQFEPHVLCMREGQTLIAKNSAAIPHNVNLIGGTTNPSLNVLIPPGGSYKIEGLRASRFPLPVNCTIHGWMKMFVRVFNHPYFAVTDEQGRFEIKDAPAGDWNLVVWQESVGWVQGGKTGVSVSIKDGQTTELEALKLPPGQ